MLASGGLVPGIKFCVCWLLVAWCLILNFICCCFYLCILLDSHLSERYYLLAAFWNFVLIIGKIGVMKFFYTLLFGNSLSGDSKWLSSSLHGLTFWSWSGSTKQGAFTASCVKKSQETQDKGTYAVFLY